MSREQFPEIVNETSLTKSLFVLKKNQPLKLSFFKFFIFFFQVSSIKGEKKKKPSELILKLGFYFFLFSLVDSELNNSSFMSSLLQEGRAGAEAKNYVRKVRKRGRKESYFFSLSFYFQIKKKCEESV